MTTRAKTIHVSDESLLLVANRFKVLGDPLRLRLLIALEKQERNVSELVSLTGAGQTTVSRHLQALAAAGMLVRRKEGQNAYYSVAEAEVMALCRLVCGSLQKRLSRQARMAGAFG